MATTTYCLESLGQNYLRSLIDPTSLSYEKIKEDLETYVQGLSDYDSWKDFFEGGAGQTTLELIAGLGTYLAYQSVFSRREAYLGEAMLSSSIYNICNTLSYPINRKQSMVLEVTVNAEEFSDEVFWYREERDSLSDGEASGSIGVVGEYEISLLNSQTIKPGVNIIECVIGVWKEQSFSVNSDDSFQEFFIQLDDPTSIDNVFRVLSLTRQTTGVEEGVLITKFPENLLGDNDESITEYYGTKLNEIILSCNTTSEIDQTIQEGRMLEVTLSDGVLLISGDGVFGTQLRSGDSFTYHYVESPGFVDVRSGDVPVTLNFGNLESVVIKHNGYPEDSLTKLRRVASGYYSSKRRMVTEEDHEYLLMSYPGIISAKFCQAGTNECCVGQLAYLFWDEHIATDGTAVESDNEKQDMLTYLDDYKIVGYKLNLIDPVKVGIDAHFIIVIKETADTGQIRVAVQDIINYSTLQLGATFYPSGVANCISRLPGVIRSYIKKPFEDRSLGCNYYFKLEDLTIDFTTDSDILDSLGNPCDGGYIEPTMTDYATGFNIDIITQGHGSQEEITTVTTIGDIDGSLDGKYIIFSTPTPNHYYIWFSVDGSDNNPMVFDRIPIKVEIAKNSSADVVAAAISSAINPDITALAAANVVTLTNTDYGDVPDTLDGESPIGVLVNNATGFSFTVTQQGSVTDPEITEIVVHGNQCCNLNGKYFYINSPSYEYYVWFSVDNSGTDPAIEGKIPVNVNINTDSDEDSVALSLGFVLDTLKDPNDISQKIFYVSIDRNKIIVTNVLPGNVTDPRDPINYGTGFIFNIIQEGDVSNAEISRINTIGDVDSSLGGRYFTLNSVTTEYYIWFNVDGSSTDPTIITKTGVEVSISENDTADDIASAISLVVGGLIDFNSSSVANLVTIENVDIGDVESIQDGPEQ